MTIKSSSSFDKSTAITRIVNFTICLPPQKPRDILSHQFYIVYKAGVYRE